MPGTSCDYSMAEILEEVAPLGVGLGILTFALFPLSVPIIVATLVLALPLVAAGLLAALLVAPIALVRRLRR